MAELRLEEAVPASPLERVGLTSAKALVACLVVGQLEGTFLSQHLGGAPSGMGFAIAGLMFPAAMLTTWLAGLVMPQLTALNLSRVRIAAGVLLGFALVFLLRLGGASLPLTIRLLPVEWVGLVFLALLLGGIDFAPPFRRVVAGFGIALAVALQIQSTGWIDAHRAFAAAIADASWLGHVMLRFVLRRIV